MQSVEQSTNSLARGPAAHEVGDRAIAQGDHREPWETVSPIPESPNGAILLPVRRPRSGARVGRASDPRARKLALGYIRVTPVRGLPSLHCLCRGRYRAFPRIWSHARGPWTTGAGGAVAPPLPSTANRAAGRNLHPAAPLGTPLCTVASHRRRKGEECVAEVSARRLRAPGAAMRPSR
jgi:hypothetical protein